MELRLIVIRTPNPQKLADFYALLGLRFEYHQHGNSPFHYGAAIGQALIEIYPLMKSQSTADKSLRLGFVIDQFDESITTLKQQAVTFATEPTQTEFGFMAVIVDPDGRKVELYKQQ